MQKFYTDYRGNLRTGNIDLFLQISIDLYKEIVQIDHQLRELEKKENTDTIPDVKVYFKEQEQIIFEKSSLNRMKYKLAVQGVVMLATYFEALINEIGIIELGAKYYKENLDKLSVQAKWEIVLKLIYSNSINKESTHYESMTNIISLRNKLVHYKTKSVDKPTKEDLETERKYSIRIMDHFENGIKKIKGFHHNLIELDEEKRILKLFGFHKELERI